MPRQPNLDRSILEVALSALENRRAELDALIGSIRRQLGSRSTLGKTAVSGGEELSIEQTGKRGAPRKRRRRVMSAEARARIAEAQRLRWAASRKRAAAPAKSKPAAKKRTMSPEARMRIAEAQKKRWAAVRKEA
jgi:hypothetical protein